MSGIEVRVLRSLAEFADVHGLFDAVWRPAPEAAPVQVELLAALAHAGNYVAGAYRGGRLVGASVAFFGEPPGVSLHSHITAATEPGVGFALKLHQRTWALERGLSRITWTFDPLVRRNAHFNLGKLAARAEEYLPSFYGVVRDEVNGGDETDRLLAVWPLREPSVIDAVNGEPPAAPVPPGAVTALGERDGRPDRGLVGESTLLVAVPADVEALRRTDPEAARAWRRAVREVLGGLVQDGARITGFHRRSCYVVEPKAGGRS
ncbi:hypothetical protein [Actinomadura flavalba]|uniref:hypothetical protein n=1 Tax=Actinomadura flavalba TaxID=1120938 RepID=UPI000366C367|nr:hypothetical protein [Actinomadura flavalba]